MKLLNSENLVATPSIKPIHNGSVLQQQHVFEAPSQIQDNQVNISQLGKVTQQIDSLFDKVDNIYLTHLSGEQKQELKSSYQQLDTLFASEQLSDSEDKVINGLFDKIDSIFQSAEQALSKDEKHSLDKIETEIESLLEIENEAFDQELNQALDAAYQQRDELLTAKLNAQQKNELTSLNESLNHLFDSHQHDENSQKVNQLFDKIDQILQASYHQLSIDDKRQIDQYDNHINELLDELSLNLEQSYDY